MRTVGVLSLVAGASALSTPVDAKGRLREIFNANLDGVLACPATKQPLRREVSVIGGLSRQALVSDGSAAKYEINDVYADLVPRSPITLADLADETFSIFSMQTGIFRTPLMAWYYERGWRQNFEAMGFPGIDKEHAEATEFFADVADGGTVVDLSCGSGLMSRRLVASGRYKRVLAMDYSEAMLRETRDRFDEERISRDSLTLVRADAGALPLASGGADAVHAGAALHCWPRLEESLGEVARALKPGGRFFATTFFEGAMPGQAAQMRQPASGQMRLFKDEGELERLLVEAGFDQGTLSIRREGRACAVIRAEAK